MIHAKSILREAGYDCKTSIRFLNFAAKSRDLHKSKNSGWSHSNLSKSRHLIGLKRPRYAGGRLLRNFEVATVTKLLFSKMLNF